MSSIFNPQDKILTHIQKVQDYFENKNPYPITIEIDPSNACNHSCPFCISGHLHLDKYKNNPLFSRVFMKDDIFAQLSHDLIKTDINSINWTGGGEPTMHPKFKENVNYIKENSKIQMGMFTNGTMFERFDLYETIVTCLEWVRISIDSGDENSYNKLRVTNKSNNFETVLQNIKKLILKKKELKSDISIGVGFVVSKDNFEEIEKFANLFKDIDVDYCQYKPEIIQIEREDKPVDRKFEQNSKNFWLNKVINKLDKAKSILGKKYECNAYKLEDLIMDPEKYGRDYKECIGSQFQPCINADGNVYVCTNHRGHKKYSYGNLEKKSFLKIWSDIKKKQEVMNLINNEEKFSKCTNLCKPHESNKILWNLKCKFKTKNDFQDIKDKIDNLKNHDLKHKNFI